MPNHCGRFFRFAIVGVIGFGVDAGVVAALIRVLAVDAYQARICSYFFAAATTWWLNRRFTFHSASPPAREFLTFLLASAIIAWRGSGGWIPVIAVAIGSLAGLFTNFFLSSKLVFAKGQFAASNCPTRRE